MTDTHINDTYAGSHMKHFLYGEHLHDYQLFITCATLIHYDNRVQQGKAKVNPNTAPARDKIHSAIIESQTIHQMLSNLQRNFDCESLECIYANALLAYNGDVNDLLIRALNFSGRVLKLSSKGEWLDNWRINAFGTCISTIMWREYDNRACFTVKRKYRSIKHDANINYKSFATHCVGVLREFIIKLNVYPNMKVPTQLTDIRRKLESSRFKSMTDKEVCDECYKHFPYTYIGSHGCNALIDGPDTGRQWTATIPEIKKYLKRYPAMIFGGVFNTSAYGEAGQHWMSVMFHNKSTSRLSGGADNSMNDVIPTSSNENFDIELYYRNHPNDMISQEDSNRSIQIAIESTGNGNNGLSDQMDIMNNAHVQNVKGLNPEAILFCSQGSGWDAFSRQAEILSALREGDSIPTTYNQENLQVSDGYSCGNFSIVSNFLMLCNDMDIMKTAKDIGRNGKNLGSLVGKEGQIDIYTMRKSLFGVK